LSTKVDHGKEKHEIMEQSMGKVFHKREIWVYFCF
jgi:hypothetical protein